MIPQSPGTLQISVNKNVLLISKRKVLHRTAAQSVSNHASNFQRKKHKVKLRRKIRTRYMLIDGGRCLRETTGYMLMELLSRGMLTLCNGHAVVAIFVNVP